MNTNLDQTSTLDLSKTYEVKQRFIEGDPTNLGNYKRSSYPDTTKLIYCPYDFNLGRFSTGMDPNHPRVLSISDPKEREAKIKELNTLREELQNLIGVDLSPRSDYYDTFAIQLGNNSSGEAYIDVKGKTLSLTPSTNPYHKLALVFLKFNNLIPGSQEEAGDARFRDAKYLLTTEEEINKDSKERVRVDILRGKNLSELFGDTINYERAWELAYFLEYGPKKGMSEDLLQEILFMKTLDTREAKRFNKACSMSNEELTVSNLFKQAVKLNIIKFNGNDKTYFRGGLNYRETEEDSIKLLMADSMSVELAQLREVVNKKARTVKNLS